MILRKKDYRDPLLILLDREARSCKGCRFLHQAEVFGRPADACGLGRRKTIKCNLYGGKDANVS